MTAMGQITNDIQKNLIRIYTKKLPSSNKFYGEYHGHQDVHLKYVHKYLKYINKNNTVYLAGDSSLDNKYWVNIPVDACNGYQNIVKGGKSRPDICHWINYLFELNKMESWCCINTAVEESTVSSRSKKLLDQDKFIQRNITKNDVLIVSVGGNDLALKINVKTMFHLGKLLLSNDVKNNSSFSFIVNLFKNETEKYIKELIKYNNPRMVILNSMYFPCLHGKSWADRTLNLFNYNKNYKKVHQIMRAAYEEGTRKVKIDDVNIVTCKLFEVLDFTNEKDYVQRVEPSIMGGYKMASQYLDIMKKNKVL